MPFITDQVNSFDDQSVSKGHSSNTLDKTADKLPLVSRFRYDTTRIMAWLRSRMAGQDEVLNGVRDMLDLVRADIGDPTRPLFIALLLGPTGVGKTELVRLLAEAIHGKRDAFCRIDMNTLSQDHYAASLTGAPPGYAGSKEGLTILDKTSIEGTYSTPGIVLFDEVEKASPMVTQTLLNIFDNGIMTVASGQQTINFRNSLIFMTSNVGAKTLQDAIKHAEDKREAIQHLGIQDIIDEGLEERFSPEFINRIDEIVVFHWITPTAAHHIIDMEIHRLNQRVARYGVTLALTDEARTWLQSEGHDLRYGARALKRTIRRHVEVPLARLMAAEFGSAPREQTITIHVSQGIIELN